MFPDSAVENIRDGASRNSELRCEPVGRPSIGAVLANEWDVCLTQFRGRVRVAAPSPPRNIKPPLSLRVPHVLSPSPEE